MNKIIVIAGPTASGKTGLSVELAKRLDIEIISADSRQVFKYLDIGTAKPTAEELSACRHHFIDIIAPDEYFSAGVFGDQAYETALDIIASGKTPVVVGGSGLYVKALCEGFFNEEEEFENAEIREKLNLELEESGKDALYDKLKNVDESAANLYSDKNPRRIIRALEYFLSTGNKFSEARVSGNSFRNLVPAYYGLSYSREDLYSRINLRTEIMWRDGLLEETKKVLEMGYTTHINALNTVGYKETIAFINGEITEEQAIEAIKMNTRRYAKRQLTWFRKYAQMTWLEPNVEVAANIIVDSFRNSD